jgi:hypothetical protein
MGKTFYTRACNFMKNMALLRIITKHMTTRSAAVFATMLPAACSELKDQPAAPPEILVIAVKTERL